MGDAQFPQPKSDPPQDQQQPDGKAKEKGKEASAKGKTNKETRWELGVFFRVHTESSTPPGDDYDPMGTKST